MHCILTFLIDMVDLLAHKLCVCFPFYICTNTCSGNGMENGDVSVQLYNFFLHIFKIKFKFCVDNIIINAKMQKKNMF